jgi:hypothetical protein
MTVSKIGFLKDVAAKNVFDIQYNLGCDRFYCDSVKKRMLFSGRCENLTNLLALIFFATKTSFLRQRQNLTVFKTWNKNVLTNVFFSNLYFFTENLFGCFDFLFYDSVKKR